MAKSSSFAAFCIILRAVFCFAVPETTLDKKPILKTVHYKIDIRIDYEQEKIFGDCRITLVNDSSEPLEKIPLLLYRLMKVISLRDEDGSPLPYSQRIQEFEDWEKLQANVIDVILKTPLRTGERKTIAIVYEGYLSGYTETGMLYVKDRVDRDFTIIRPDCLAYPEVGYPSWALNRTQGLQSFSYEINVSVPDNLIVANGGRLTGSSSQNGRTTYSYKNILPAWRIDVAVAKYGILEDRQNGLRIFHFQGDEDGGRRVLQALKDVSGIFNKWFGPAKGPADFSVIEIPEGFGSQADVTSILQTRDAFRNEDQLVQFYHEISHRWNVLSLDPSPPRFESEGLAMMLQYLVWEKLEKQTGSLDKGAERLRENFRRACRENKRAKDTAMIGYGKEGLTDLSYSKGMLFFYILLKLAGEDNFLNAIQGFYRTYKDKGATSAEFLSYLKGSLKIPLDKFFHDWIYGSSSSEDLLGPRSLDEIILKYRR